MAGSAPCWHILLTVILLSVLLPLLVSSESALERKRRRPPTDCPACTGQEPRPRPGKFDFYYLVRQWPFEFCTFKQPQKRCFFIPDESAGFTLHGLWPNLNNTCYEDYPEHCSNDEFDADRLPRATVDALQYYWPSYSSPYECFWRHEWGCHGTCSGLSQEEYFQSTLELHEGNDLMAALSANSLSASGNVKKSDLMAAFRSYFGFEPIVNCRKDGSKYYLKEVWMCVKRGRNNALEVVDCRSVCSDCWPTKPCKGDYITFAGPDTVILRPDTDTCTLDTCRPQSGTCNPRRGVAEDE